MENNIKLPFLTRSVKRLTAINIVIFFLVLLLFNILLMFLIYFILHNNLDNRIAHEIENISKGLSVNKNSITVIDSSEFYESDLYEYKSTSYFLQIFNLQKKQIIKSRNINLYKYIPYTEFDTTKIQSTNSYSFEGKNLRAGYLKLMNTDGNHEATLRLSIFERDFEIIVNQLIMFNLIGFFIIALIIIAASVLAAKKTFKPINNIIDNANRFNAENLSKRISVKADPLDEIGRLRDTLNGLFQRIEDHVNEITHFSDHVSHQLMNPLTAIRTEIEYQLKKERTADQYKEALVGFEGQVDNLINIIKTLLMIAKSGKIKSECKKVFSLSKLIRGDVLSYFKNYKIKYEIEDNLYLRGESEKVYMVLQNLIHNALKYSPESEEVLVIAKSLNDKIVVSVQDNGIGINDFEKANIFQKFYRTPQAEKLGIKGFGLGLSLVKSIVEEASGSIEVIDNKPNGTIFNIYFKRIELN